MILDPSRDGCTIWSGNKVQFIKGDADECCKKIINYITDEWDDKTKHQWCYDIRLDTKGIGMAYADYFSRCGVEFIPVVPSRIV